MKKILLVDNHVHVGWYKDGYHSPSEIWKACQRAGIDEIVVSSTSTCAELYKNVVQEMKELIILGGSHVHPVLWITPRMVKSYGLSYMLHSKVKWQLIKMHWGAHREWYYNRRLVSKVLNVSRKKDLPVLLHTGEFKECEANVFENICKQNPDLLFILAHGRPIQQTIDLLEKYSNVFVDTAFMPAKNVKKLIDKNLISRILYGSDIPINGLFCPGIKESDFILDQIKTIKKEIGEENFLNICGNTAYNLKKVICFD